MKIISKRKDYYDYLVNPALYGTDTLRVYDRRADNYGEPGGTDKLNPLLEHYDFAVCGMIYRIYQYKGKFYHTKEDWVKLDQLLSKGDPGNRARFLFGDTLDQLERDAARKYDKVNVPTDVNKALREPVLMKTSGGGEFTYKSSWSNEFMHDTARIIESTWSKVILKDFGFQRVMAAEEIFMKISEFLGWLVDNPPIPNKQTNIEKLESHGFDKKKSFRHRK